MAVHCKRTRLMETFNMNGMNACTFVVHLTGLPTTVSGLRIAMTNHLFRIICPTPFTILVSWLQPTTCNASLLLPLFVVSTRYPPQPGRDPLLGPLFVQGSPLGSNLWAMCPSLILLISTSKSSQTLMRTLLFSISPCRRRTEQGDGAGCRGGGGPVRRHATTNKKILLIPSNLFCFKFFHRFLSPPFPSLQDVGHLPCYTTLFPSSPPPLHSLTIHPGGQTLEGRARCLACHRDSLTLAVLVPKCQKFFIILII